jgi:hypothetical protein
MDKEKSWTRLLAYIMGLVNQELLLQNEYLATENRVLRAHLPSRLRLSDPERETLAEIGKSLDARLWPRWRLSPNPIRFWRGTGGS